MSQYYFKCGCSDGCENLSQELGKDYRRLIDEIWVIKTHLNNELHEIVEEFKGGYIVKVKGEF